MGSNIEITGIVLDTDLKEYWVQYGQGDSPSKWVRIGELGVKQGRNIPLATWDASGLTPDKYTIRLSATDIMGHERYDDVVVYKVSASEYIIKSQGGYAGKLTDRISLYIPPNALKQDMQIMITLMGDASVVASANIEPAETILMKPATLTFRYDNESINGKDKSRLVLFYRNGTDWERIGGTVDIEENKISTAITRFGRYSVKEDLSVDTGKLSINDIDCQPRVFSPRGGGFGPRTAIFFRLGKSANVTVKVYNRSGKLRRLLEENKDMNRGNNVVYWDGKDDDDNIVESDLYIVAVTAEDMTVTKPVAVSNR